MNIRQPDIVPTKAKRQLRVIDAQEIKHVGVQIVNCESVFDRAIAVLIRRPVHGPALDAAAGAAISAGDVRGVLGGGAGREEVAGDEDVAGGDDEERVFASCLDDGVLFEGEGLDVEGMGLETVRDAAGDRSRGRIDDVVAGAERWQGVSLRR